jgi:integrase
VKIEVNSATNYRRDIIEAITRFAAYNMSGKNKDKKFKDMTRDDVISFLESFRKSETVDPLHKWIGTYNTYQVHLVRFFRWLYAPDIEPSKRPKPTAVANVPKLKRREARPHEILGLKIGDISFKTVPNGRQYVEVTVNGKTGTRRPLPLINSIPFLKDYLDHEHPFPSNPNAPLICGMGKMLGRHISSIGISKTYAKYKHEVFPRLLGSPTTLPEDKQKIRELLKKPWNPYIRRHSALTEKSLFLKEHVLRQAAGWSPGSQMHLRYLHYFGSESTNSILEEYGLIDKGTQQDPLQPKQCPNCGNGNKPDDRFCAKCRMVLTYDAYNETLEIQKEKEDRLTTIERQFNTMQSQMQSLLSSLGTIKDQNQVNQIAKTLYNSKILKKKD